MLHAVPLSASVSSEFSGFFPPPRNMPGGLAMLKLQIGVNVKVNVCVHGVL